MRDLAAFFGLFIAAMVMLATLFIGGGFVGLWWYPFQRRMQQQMIVNSPAFVQSKEQEISTFMLAYSGTNSARQKKGILQTICLDASQVHVPLPGPQAVFTSKHCP